MSSEMQPAMPGGEFILYQTADGRTRVQCRFENNTLWLTQAQIAELFQSTPQNVTLHLKAIYAEGELTAAATCKGYLQVRQEGARNISRNLLHYRLEAILAVGYRVRSPRGAFTRKCSTFTPPAWTTRQTPNLPSNFLPLCKTKCTGQPTAIPPPN